MTTAPAFAADGPARWEIHPATDFSRFRPQWDEVNAAAGGSPLLTSAFADLLLREFASGSEHLAIYRGRDRVEAVAILRRKSASFWETFQPSQAPVGLWIGRPEHDFASLAQRLLKDLPGLALALGVTQQDPELRSRPPEGATTATIDYIDTARVRVAGSFDDYWAARGKNLRTNTKRQRSRLEKEGIELRLETLRDAESMAEAIADYGRLESRGWKGTAGTAIHPDNAQGRFYRALLEDCCRRGRGRVFRYRYGDAVVAVDLCIENDEADTIVILKTTYDETIRDSSPASLLRHEYFRELFDEGKIRRIEFYGKVMEWHTRLTDDTRTLYHANFYRWAAVASLHRMLGRRARVAEPALTEPSSDAADAKK